jgi:hypothetical protein
VIWSVLLIAFEDTAFNENDIALDQSLINCDLTMRLLGPLINL